MNDRLQVKCESADVMTCKIQMLLQMHCTLLANLADPDICIFPLVKPPCKVA